MSAQPLNPGERARLDQLEATIAEGIAGYVRVCDALAVIRSQLTLDEWADYCATRFHRQWFDIERIFDLVGRPLPEALP